MRMSRRHWLTLALPTLCVGVPARAQSPAPLGHWRSRTSAAQLIVHQNGLRAFLGSRPVQGNCTWNASSRGGILTLIYPMPLEPGKIYFNIVWVDQATISVFGELFSRQ